MATIINRLVPPETVGDPFRVLEAAAREVLRGLDDEELTVSFGIWDDGDGVQYVCKIETPLRDPSSAQPPWRWWSPLFRTAEELRAELAQVVARRFGDPDARLPVPAGGAATGAEAAAAG
jgi:hypothetical protein